MTRTGILRYSNIERDSIAEHESIVRSHNSVWWGWWKKETEALPMEFLEYLRSTVSRGSPISIGLLNRKDDQYFAATCVGAFFASDPAACPSPPLVPSYYRDQKLHAWFEFTAFERLYEERFLERFGYIPQIDATLYDITLRPEGNSITPQPQWNMETRRLKGSTILHISDLHFGNNHAYARAGHWWAKATHLDDLVKDAVSAQTTGGARVGVVVVSGDLTTRGEQSGFDDAHEFLDNLLTKLELDRDDVIIAPGNHDTWVRDIQRATRDYAHERPYRSFLEAFYGRPFQDLEWFREFESDEVGLTVFALNSARLRSLATHEFGYVGLHRYEQMLDLIDRRRYERGSPHRVMGVLHHHVRPLPMLSSSEDKRLTALTLDAGQLLANSHHFRVDALLHGHRHVPNSVVDEQLTDGPLGLKAHRLAVLGAGSVGADPASLPEQDRFNRLSFYSLTERGFGLQMAQFSPSVSPLIYRDQDVVLDR